MKLRFYHIIFFLLLTNCVSEKNSESFIKKTAGRYLFNADETIEIYFKESELFAKWRGNDAIKSLKVNDSTFYIKELNEKLIFYSSPDVHIKLAPKTEHEGRKYLFSKLKKGEKTPKEYLESNQFDLALKGYLKIKTKDSLNRVINEWNLNRLGYNYVREKDYEKAIEVFKINVVLYPENYNVYDSLGEGYLLIKDTVNAIKNYEKSLDLNNENRNAERMLNRIYKK